ncbi:hypothetical protein AAFF_G00354560 [Aldrovandia affinis]|uniref:Obscurin n=1 Tax=Aldrovandia affinis TaxID=143900 RepID=A0AAD7SIM0_9TELE|nr:hypothetical protein AAFF_G00354560 [Aldrovandia affinis]
MLDEGEHTSIPDTRKDKDIFTVSINQSAVKQFFCRQKGQSSSPTEREKRLIEGDLSYSLQQQQKTEDLSISKKLKESVSSFTKVLSRQSSKEEKKEEDRLKGASTLSHGKAGVTIPKKKTLLGAGEASSHKKTSSHSFKLPVCKKIKEPVFLEELADQAVSFGQGVTLWCRLDGHPTPEIQWYKEDQKLKFTDQMKLGVTDKEILSLTISSVKQEDLGIYHCIANNTVGHASTSCNLIFSAPAAPPPHTSPDKHAATTSEGDFHIPLIPMESPGVADTVSAGQAAHHSYSFLSEINRGRFSVVRQCQDDQSKQLFAAKITPYKQEQKQLVLHEYQLLKRLDHPHIVQLHAAFITPCYLVLIEELCAGHELLHNLAERDLYAEIHVSELLQQILSAVDYLHCNSIVHLDLKSDNMLVTDHNLLKIVDLGSAQTFTPGQTLSVEHIQETKDSKVYIVLPKAPEILDGQGVGPETDIWAIGVLAFIMLSADNPFHSNLHWESERNIRNGKIQFWRCYPGLSDGSVNFIKRTLNNKPWGRPSAAECLQIPWIQGMNQSSRHRDSIVCFSTDKLQAYLGKREIKREQVRTKVDVPLFD